MEVSATDEALKNTNRNKKKKFKIKIEGDATDENKKMWLRTPELEKNSESDNDQTKRKKKKKHKLKIEGFSTHAALENTNTQKKKQHKLKLVEHETNSESENEQTNRKKKKKKKLKMEGVATDEALENKEACLPEQEKNSELENEKINRKKKKKKKFKIEEFSTIEALENIEMCVPKHDKNSESQNKQINRTKKKKHKLKIEEFSTIEALKNKQTYVPKHENNLESENEQPNRKKKKKYKLKLEGVATNEELESKETCLSKHEKNLELENEDNNRKKVKKHKYRIGALENKEMYPHEYANSSELKNDQTNSADYDLKFEEKKVRLDQAIESIAAVGTYSRKKFDERHPTSRKGKFGRVESEKVIHATKAYLAEIGVPLEEFLDASNSNSRRYQDVWRKIASCIEDRTARSISQHVRRKLCKYIFGWNEGRWNEEEVEYLKELVEVFGKRWTHLGQILAREPAEIRTKYRELGDYKTGHWTMEETRTYFSILRECCGVNENAPLTEIMKNESSISWVEVAEKMKTRGYNQCIKKYLRAKQKYKRSLREGTKQKYKRSLKEGTVPCPDGTLQPRVQKLLKDIDLLKAIQDSGADSDSEVVWSEILHISTHSLSRWKVLQRFCPADLKYRERIQFLINDRENEVNLMNSGPLKYP